MLDRPRSSENDHHPAGRGPCLHQVDHRIDVFQFMERDLGLNLVPGGELDRPLHPLRCAGALCFDAVVTDYQVHDVDLQRFGKDADDHEYTVDPEYLGTVCIGSFGAAKDCRCVYSACSSFLQVLDVGAAREGVERDVSSEVLCLLKNAVVNIQRCHLVLHRFGVLDRVLAHATASSYGYPITSPQLTGVNCMES
jgi:hypothetical protein